MEASRSITQRSASNLALAFIMLPKHKRDAMSVLYAFCREVDDVADDEAVSTVLRRERLAAWRADVCSAYGEATPQFQVNRELKPVIKDYKLPFKYFDELILGVEMDLDIKRYQTFEDLELYCYRVASLVGLLSIEIFGYKNPECHDYAIYLGKALQLTNILRDVRSDAERGRIYLPQQELLRHKVKEEDILSFKYTPQFFELASAVAERASYFYQQARSTLPREDRRSMVAAELMGSVYWRLLKKLERCRFDVLGPEPTRLSKVQKLSLIFKTWCRFVLGTMSPAYGLP
jgi:phytoene synthase